MSSQGGSLDHIVCYQGLHGSARWVGCHVEDREVFQTFLQGPVSDRIRDAETADPFADELRSLVSSGMATEHLERLLRAVPRPPAWEIGEALAESILVADPGRSICWPWNTVRDRRTPRASLPGADLVGFCRQGDRVLLLLGEVKTSADPDTPPNVMYSPNGMSWQLEESATRLDVQHTLLKWLLVRCSSPEHRELYRSAVGHYLASEGKELLLIGVLLRDTSPSERDLKSRAIDLAKRLPAPTRIELLSWYLPVPIEQWPALLEKREP